MPIKREASLLPESENINSFSSRFIHYITTVGRVVIIFTELIVVASFLSRFWLDRQNSDLSEVLRQQRAILESTQDFEKEYVLLQQRLLAIKAMYSQSPDFQQKLATLAASTPPEVIYKNMTINQDPSTKNITISLDLTSYTEEAAVKFINNLSLNPEISSVNVKSIEKKPKEEGYTISLTLLFKKVKANT